nr:hypothetical protein [Arthrobacter sp. CAL618]
MISIREAEKLDLTFLPAIEAAADSLLTYLNGMPLPVSLPAGASRSELAASLKLLVAGRPCIGFARLEELDGGAHLEQLAVLPAHAGRGDRAGAGRSVEGLGAARWLSLDYPDYLRGCPLQRPVLRNLRLRNGS